MLFNTKVHLLHRPLVFNQIATFAFYQDCWPRVPGSGSNSIREPKAFWEPKAILEAERQVAKAQDEGPQVAVE